MAWAARLSGSKPPGRMPRRDPRQCQRPMWPAAYRTGLPRRNSPIWSDAVGQLLGLGPIMVGRQHGVRQNDECGLASKKRENDTNFHELNEFWPCTEL